MSIPGQQEVTVQLNLGLVDKKKNQWESKKIDFIIIEFTKPPKDFRILCWYPGSAWIMLKSFQGYSKHY